MRYKINSIIESKVFGILCLIIVGVMAWADYLTMYNFFNDLGVSTFPFSIKDFEIPLSSEAYIYSFTAACFLEGLPFFMGHAASVLADKTRYKANDSTNAKVGFIVSLVGLLFAFALVIFVRIEYIKSNGGIEAFEAKNYGGNDKTNRSYIAHLFTLGSPVITSILAFVASWLSARSNSFTKLERECNAKHEELIIAQSKFLEAVHRNDDARIALWRSLSETDSMPSDLDTFRTMCFERIRQKLIINCIVEFPGQVHRLDSEIKVLLKTFMEQMYLYTTDVPDDLPKLEEIINDYDNNNKDKNPSETFEYSICGPILEKELKTVIDNAVVVAQFKTSIKPYHREVSRWL